MNVRSQAGSRILAWGTIPLRVDAPVRHEDSANGRVLPARVPAQSPSRRVQAGGRFATNASKPSRTSSPRSDSENIGKSIGGR